MTLKLAKPSTSKLVLAKSYVGVDDPDAAAYIAAVETADGQSLETAVKVAIHSFVKGCKADGIWPAIKASCILAGARTLAGALVPLVGAAPTNFNFVAGDYNRKTGLMGNAANKVIDSNRSHQAEPQNSRHISCYVSELSTSIGNGILMGNVYAASGWSYLISRTASGSPPNRYEFGISQGIYPPGVARSTGLVGASRNNSANYSGRSSLTTNIYTATSQTPSSGNFFVFGTSTANDFVNARLAFYSIGEALDLALLDARVTNLINAIGAAF